MDNNELKELLERVVASLTEEQKQKAMACETVDQLTTLLGEMGVELPDELLDDVGGGFNLSSLFTRPLVAPGFLFGTAEGYSEGAVHMDLQGRPIFGATHMDMKGGSSFGAVHTDVSAGTKQSTGRYV